MSRIGKKAIDLPKGVTIQVDGSNVVSVKGPKGELRQQIDPDLKLEVQDGKAQLSRPTDQIRHRSAHGLYRTLISNMVVGVSEGYTRELEVIGVGYKAEATGQALELTLGHSHLMMVVLPKEISVATETKKGSNPRITLKGIDKQLIGHFAAKIRSLRGPEPYKGKGIRYVGEDVRRKAGKAAAKK
ncbi:MAG: 50S ribosomal protein L6 [Bacteroidia bacterium]